MLVYNVAITSEGTAQTTGNILDFPNTSIEYVSKLAQIHAKIS